MAIEGIAAAALATQAMAGGGASGDQTPATSFSTWLQQNLDAANRQIVEGDAKVAELAAGGDVQLHDVMLSLEEAKLSFELILAIRNKALEAYQEVMRMQI